MPEDMAIPAWEKAEPVVGVTVEYLGRPAIGFGDACPLLVRVHNGTGRTAAGEVRFTGLPEGFSAELEAPAVLRLGPGEEAAVKAVCRTAAAASVSARRTGCGLVCSARTARRSRAVPSVSWARWNGG